MGIRKVLNDKFREVLELIPHRSPMVMIDKLVESNDQSTTSTFLIRGTCIFCQEGLLTESGLIENLAQTGAARMGYNSNALSKKSQIGFIGAIKDLTINFLPAVNTELKSTIIIEHEIYNAVIIKAKIENEGSLACECEMKLFLHDHQ